jgi:hypothetical protein
MDGAGSSQKPDYVNGRLVSSAGSRKRLKRSQGVMSAGTLNLIWKGSPNWPYIWR